MKRCTQALNSLSNRSLHVLVRGFTLIELMIVVGIVAVLAAIAIPSYNDYIMQGRLTNGTNGLSTIRAEMERHFQDNRSYGTVGTFTAPCLDVTAQGLARRTFGEAPNTFVISCLAADGGNPTNSMSAAGVSGAGAAGGYTLVAVGSGSIASFRFLIDNTGNRATPSAATGWGTSASKWCVKKGC